MDKKRVKILITVLEAIKDKHLETKNFIEKAINCECFKESMPAEEVIFFHV